MCHKILAMELKVCRVFKDLLDQVVVVHREQVRKAQRAFKAHKVYRALTEYKDTLDKQVFKVLQVHKGILVFKVLLDTSVQMVTKVHKVYKVLLVNLPVKVFKVYKVKLVYKGLLVYKVA